MTAGVTAGGVSGPSPGRIRRDLLGSRSEPAAFHLRGSADAGVSAGAEAGCGLTAVGVDAVATGPVGVGCGFRPDAIAAAGAGTPGGPGVLACGFGAAVPGGFSAGAPGFAAVCGLDSGGAAPTVAAAGLDPVEGGAAGVEPPGVP